MDKARKLGLDEFVQANPSKFQHAELFRSLQKLTLDYRLNDIYTCLVRPSNCLAFYRAMLCIRGTSRGPVSVRLSVRHKSEFY